MFGTEDEVLYRRQCALFGAEFGIEASSRVLFELR